MYSLSYLNRAKSAALIRRISKAMFRNTYIQYIFAHFFVIFDPSPSDGKISTPKPIFFGNHSKYTLTS